MTDYGADFVKKVKPFGAVMILLISAIGTIMLFTADMGVPARHEPLHSTEYYLQSYDTMTGLLEELEQHIFPAFDTDIQGRVEFSDGNYHLVIITDRTFIGRVRAVLERDFDPVLFEFEEA
jgi:hypothetical protein